MSQTPKPPVAGGASPSPAPAPPSPSHAGDATAVPATTWQKALLFAFLLVLAGLLLRATYAAIHSFNQGAFAESAVAWDLPVGARLKPGPAGFRYDAQQKMLRHRGPLDARQQLQLRDLLEFDGVGEVAASERPADASSAASQASAAAARAAVPRADRARSEPPTRAGRPSAPDSSASAAPTASAAREAAELAVRRASSAVQNVQRSYYAAIESLASESSTQQAQKVQLLLLLGMLGGALGAVLRSLVDFVGHACYTGKLDLHRWWPLYATRPLVGAILGFVLVVLFKAQLLTGGDAQSVDDSFWWLGMAVIGGFSTVDVTLRLRLAAKALFGVESGEKKDDLKDDKKEGKKVDTPEVKPGGSG